MEGHSLGDAVKLVWVNKFSSFVEIRTNRVLIRYYSSIHSRLGHRGRMLPMHSGCCQSELVLRPVHTARQPQGLSEKSAEVQKVQKPKLVSCFLYQNWILMWVCFLAFFNLTVWVSSLPGANSEVATALELKLKLWIKSTSNLSTLSRQKCIAPSSTRSDYLLSQCRWQTLYCGSHHCLEAGQVVCGDSGDSYKEVWTRPEGLDWQTRWVFTCFLLHIHLFISINIDQATRMCL